MNYKEALDLVKDALHQHKEQKYDEPAVMAYSAMEKQIPKKPIKLPESEQHMRYTDTYRCPTCGGNFSGTGVADYCYHCGQRLDWGKQE